MGALCCHEPNAKILSADERAPLTSAAATLLSWTSSTKDIDLVSAKFEKENSCSSHKLDCSKRKIFCVVAGEVCITSRKFDKRDSVNSPMKRISLVFTDSAQSVVTLRQVRKGELIHLFGLGSVESSSQARAGLTLTCSARPKIRKSGEVSATVEVPDICSLRSGIVNDLCETLNAIQFTTLLNLSIQDISKFGLFRGFADDQLRLIGPLLNLVRLPPRAIVSIAGCTSAHDDPVCALPLIGSYIDCHDLSFVKAAIAGHSITRDEILTITTSSDADDGSKKSISHLGRAKQFSPKGSMVLGNEGIVVDPSDSFGIELCLLPNAISTRSIISSSDAVLGLLSSSTLRALFEVDPQIKTLLTMNVVASLLRSVVTYIPMFDGMTEADIDALAVGTEMSAYQLNDVVYSKGELGDKFFIVLKGDVEVVYENPTPTSEEDSLLFDLVSDNNCFGEAAIVTKANRTNTAIAASPLLVLSIDEKIFHSVTDYHNKSSPKFIEQKISYAGIHAELHLILSCPKGFDEFSVFIAQEHSAENLEFFTAVNNFESFCEKTSHRLNLGNRNSFSGAVGESVKISHEPAFKQRGDLQSIHDTAQSVADKFIIEKSEFEVNIPGKMRKMILENLKSYGGLTENGEVSHLASYQHLFTDAKKEIYCLMEKDIFPRWKATSKYKAFVDSIRPAKDMSRSSSFSLNLSSHHRKKVIDMKLAQNKVVGN